MFSFFKTSVKNIISLSILVGFSFSAQALNDTLKVLFVGNSYTYTENLPQIISLLCDQTNTKVITQKSVAGGANLSEHWHGKRGLKTKELILTGHFDIVVLQEHSMGTINAPDTTLLYINKFSNLIKAVGSKTYLYNTWAREKVPQYQIHIDSIYHLAALQNSATIVPVGKAWQLAKSFRPSIELYNPDGSHPSYLGTFLTACVFSMELSKEISDSIKSEFKIIDENGEWIQLMYVDQLDILFCKKITEQICD